jgi:hypothetical protein
MHGGSEREADDLEENMRSFAMNSSMHTYGNFFQLSARSRKSI